MLVRARPLYFDRPNARIIRHAAKLLFESLSLSLSRLSYLARTNAGNTPDISIEKNAAGTVKLERTAETVFAAR